MATKKKNGSRDKDILKFPLDTAMKKSYRVAAFLDWWANQYPRDFAQVNEITRAINAYPHLPRLNNEEVVSVNGQMSRVDDILHKKYKRSLIRHRALGVRASVDSLDDIEHTQMKKAKRIQRAVASFQKTDEHIDVSSIPNKPENKASKDWYTKDIGHVLKLFSAPEFMGKLLPKASASASAEKK